MELRQRLAGLSLFEWFLIIFILLMVGGAGYALGTQTAGKDERLTPKRFHFNKRLVPEQDQTKEPLQGQPSNLQGGDTEVPPANTGEIKEVPPSAEDDLIYPYDPGYCNPRKPVADRECIY